MHYKADLVHALNLEIGLQKDYLGTNQLESIYFGGGTPSLLNHHELASIFQTIYRNYSIADHAEITLEANPDDLNDEHLKALEDSPVNRLSIGIQSFRDVDLEYMNRSHNAKEAWQCVDRARKYGFDNLSLDLIYGIPGLDQAAWKENIRIAMDLGPDHISAYCLTVEPKTPLEKRIKKGLAMGVNDQDAANHFDFLMDQMDAEGFLHYEISNFAKPGHLALHNTNYWKGVSYLGIGPSAHSFDKISRQWNVANNQIYIQSILDRKIPAEIEILQPTTQYHEYIMTGLRTQWGVDLSVIAQFGEKFATHFEENILPFIQNGRVIQSEKTFQLSREGKFYADQIAMDLFVDE